mmetsp:Transcript_22068/g.69091  ORF Transcript_22068/g.69091 Transcript_22068/m.69091 type:complete len:200 (-) Transcript_22068:38-637(-)
MAVRRRTASSAATRSSLCRTSEAPAFRDRPLDRIRRSGPDRLCRRRAVDRSTFPSSIRRSGPDSLASPSTARDPTASFVARGGRSSPSTARPPERHFRRSGPDRHPRRRAVDRPSASIWSPAPRRRRELLFLSSSLAGPVVVARRGRGARGRRELVLSSSLASSSLAAPLFVRRSANCVVADLADSSPPRPIGSTACAQ